MLKEGEFMHDHDGMSYSHNRGSTRKSAFLHGFDLDWLPCVEFLQVVTVTHNENIFETCNTQAFEYE
jgi:hypothetical protein